MADKSSEPKKLIVVLAFNLDDEGELRPTSDPLEFQSEDRAVRAARLLATSHASVIAWSRDANPDVGEYGKPTILFTSGDVPVME